MTQTFTAEYADLHPVDVLVNVLVTLLAPMFIAGAEGDIRLARAAALETIDSYRAQNHASLIAVAKIVAFGLCTLSSLSLSMLDDVPIPLILSLRGNANALDRSCGHCERVLREARSLPPAEAPAAEAPVAEAPAAGAPAAGAPAVEAPGTGSEAAAIPAGVADTQQAAAECPAPTPAAAPAAPPVPAAAPAAPPVPAAKRAEPSPREQWAAAMARVAAEELAEVAHLPPDQRREAEELAAVLSSTANTLFSGPAADRPGTARGGG